MTWGRDVRNRIQLDLASSWDDLVPPTYVRWRRENGWAEHHRRCTCECIVRGCTDEHPYSSSKLTARRYFVAKKKAGKVDGSARTQTCQERKENVKKKKSLAVDGKCKIDKGSYSSDSSYEDKKNPR